MRISALVELARQGRLRVPGFQRGFRWSGADVLELFDSVWRGYPVGSLLLWQRPAPATVVAFGHVTVDAPAFEDALWVVDGQHRLTAFVAVLANEGAAGGPFELYFDLDGEKLRRRSGPAQVPATWLPLAGLLDQNALFARLLDSKGAGLLTDEQTDAALKFATGLRDYELPLSIVKTDEEPVVRRIFDRLNSSGKRLKASEVFRSLHAAGEDEEGTDLREVVETVGAAGFGQIGDDTVLRCVLAARGGDPYRDFREEFADADSLREGLRSGTAAILRTFSFLERDAWIPHRRALPYTATLPVLARFFAVFSEPADQTRQLLRRWVWRGALAWRGGRDVAVVRRAVQGIRGGDESAAALELLAGLGDESIADIDLNAVQLNRAAARLNVALLNAMRPLDLRTDEPVDVAALLDRDDPPFQVIAPEAGLVGRLLHPAVDDDDLSAVLVAASEAALSSHALPPDAVAALLDGDSTRFAAGRAGKLAQALEERRAALAETQAPDRPAIDALVVADDDFES
jgi:hypothetical protein